MDRLREEYPDSLEFHRGGKLKVLPRKELKTKRDLSLAYTPGVAIPCMEIAKDARKAYEYTSKGNLVAVISNGTAVLGLGDIGPLGSKPVMEGKCVLFKEFADIDAFDIEVDEKDPERFVAHVKAISKTFGGINLEDIKAPECFYIEERLKKECDIPIMHDDQHGTAIITAAAMLGALEIAGKSPENIKVVIIGAGAAAIASAKIYQSLGVKNILMFDSKGVIHTGREDCNSYKKEFAVAGDITLEEAFVDADMAIGLSRADVIKADMLKKMAKDPIIFALSNPVPEILPSVAKEIREDVIMATGRSDFPNQVNNVLGFPYIFKGALEAKATSITEGMKLAAVEALCALAKEEVSSDIKEIYGSELAFGREYLIPKPFDKRLKERVSGAVREAALREGATH